MKIAKVKLTIDLDAIVANWLLMRSYVHDPTDCGAVVKANAYGLGVEAVATELLRAGCRTFYVSCLEEAVQLKSIFSSENKSPKIFVLTGCRAGEEEIFLREKIIPVIISEEMFHRWLSICWLKEGDFLNIEAALKINSGMGRLGLEEKEFYSLLDSPEKLKGAGIRYLFSHLACADCSDHELNALQLQRFQEAFKKIKNTLPEIKASLSNSAGITLSSDYHFDFVRPGISLYGGQPRLDIHLPLKTVVKLELPIIQIRKLPPGECVGYGATRSWSSLRKIAAVMGGYADGILRSLGNSGFGIVNAEKVYSVPLVGRVSMDTVLFDITEVKPEPKEGDFIELVGEEKALESLAEEAKTSNYEILTGLGSRYSRHYVHGL